MNLHCRLDFRLCQVQRQVRLAHVLRGHPRRPRGRLQEAARGLPHPAAPLPGGDGGVPDRLPERHLWQEGRQQVQDADQERLS